jgi:isopenicillin-N N-acyltransferase-like protein
MSLPVLRLSGSPYEMGLMHGRELRDRIAHNLAIYFDRFEREIHMDRAAIREPAQRFVELAQKASPDYYVRMQGIAEGSGFDLLDIAAINARYEILYYQFGRIAIDQGWVEWDGPKDEDADEVFDHSLREPTPDGCTSFAVLPAMTANGHLLVGQNWDWIPEVQGAVLHTTEPDGLQTLAYTECGIVGAKIGFNSEGVSLCINGMTTIDDDWARAVTPFHVRCYKIMRSRSLEEAINVLEGEGRACAGNFLIAQSPDRVADVEAAPDNINVLSCEDGCLTHANHFVDPKGLGIVEAPSERRIYSRRRQNRLRELLTAHAPLTIEAVQETLRDTRDDPFGICRHRDLNVGQEEHYTTVTAVVMDLTDKVLYLTDGPPDESPFQTVTMQA